MDARTNFKYQMSKRILKQWESDFKKSTNQIPTKADIKCAPTKIKEAYRTYWKLKTSVLETTLADILDDSAKDCFNSSNESQDDNNKSQNISQSEDSVCFKALGDDTTASCFNSSSSFNLSHQSQNSEKDDQKEETKDSSKSTENSLNFSNIITKNKANESSIIDSVWGQHLNQLHQKTEENDMVKKLEKKSVSFKYTEKLFKASKFNKRNPRKPLKLTKSKTMGSISTSDTKISPEFSDVKKLESFSQPLIFTDDLKLNFSPASQPSITDDEKEDDHSFKIFGGKAKIVTQTTTPASTVQAVSVLQKTFDSKAINKESSFTKIDKGWLERVAQSSQLPDNKKLENLSEDSGIDVSHSHSSSADAQDLKNTCNSDDEEDLIYDSDSESQNTSTCKLNLVSIPTLPTFSKASLHKVEERSQKIESDAKDDVLVNKRKLEDQIESTTKKRKLDEYEYKECTTKPEILKPIRKSQKPEKKLSALEEKKLALLEKDLASGKANQNFVSINIEKKKFVRGKKSFTFSKYKKQKWKQLKKDNELMTARGSSRGVLKCYKCGDIGHFSKACPQAGKTWMPLEEYESDDESPFPTLEDAAEKAQEAAEAAHNGKRLFTTNNVKSDKKDNAKPSTSEQTESSDVFEFSDPLSDLPESRSSDIKPIFELNEDGSTKATPALVYDALREFGYSTFLPGQEEAVMRVLSGQSTLVTLSTGSGKSLCYQLPAYIYSKYNQSCITLVVSPLISLMEDQVQGVAHCLKIASLHTNQTEKKRAAVIEDLKAGNLSVLLISPETLVSLESGSAKSLLAHLPPIAFACVDEAHCLYQWCHNFRPSYMTVTQVLKEKLGVKTLLGLTATASHSTVECILGHLGLDPYDLSGVIADTPLPDNLILSVSTTNSEEEKQRALLELLNSEKFSNCHSIIVYCTRREQCEKVASFLRTTLQRENGNNTIGRLSVHAEVYHAGLTAGRRNQVQSKFMSGKLRIVVATMAFGMGIDKTDIRGIIHFNMPSTFENYVQEVGRAGRDRKPAHCHLFLDEKKHDVGELRRHIYSNTIDRYTIRKLLELVFVGCNCKDECAKHEVAFPIEDTVQLLDIPQENISTLLAYLELDKNKWIKSLPLVYTKCKVQSYKGENHLKRVAKSSPPLAMAMAMAHQEGKTAPKSLDFDVVSLARKINWDSGVVKRTLKNLEWTTVDSKPSKSGLTVELYKLGFRVLSPGNLSDSELDDALDILHNMVMDQEKNSLSSLQAFYNALRRVSYKSIAEYISADESSRSESLKDEIRSYFNNSNSVRNVPLDEVKLENEEAIASDIRRLITFHQTENNLTGRTIARILHGIGSPNFPPYTWGRTKFWRLHLKEDFNLLCKLATKQLILMR